MEDIKMITVGDKKIKCVGYYCYNDHYNTTVFEVPQGESPRYLGEIPDLRVNSSDFTQRVTDFVRSVL